MKPLPSNLASSNTNYCSIVLSNNDVTEQIFMYLDHPARRNRKKKIVQSHGEQHPCCYYLRVSNVFDNMIWPIRKFKHKENLGEKQLPIMRTELLDKAAQGSRRSAMFEIKSSKSFSQLSSLVHKLVGSRPTN